MVPPRGTLRRDVRDRFTVYSAVRVHATAATCGGPPLLRTSYVQAAKILVAYPKEILGFRLFAQGREVYVNKVQGTSPVARISSKRVSNGGARDGGI